MKEKNNTIKNGSPVETETPGGNGDLTELVFILDRSGSMGPVTEDTVGGFNSLLEKQKREGGRCLIDTILFNQETFLLHDRLDITAIDPLTQKDYIAYGSTALLDAVGETLERVQNIRKYLRKEDIPTRTLVIITTDGMENASHRYTKEQVKAIIDSLREELGWEFLFIGANIDSVSTAGGLGIPPERSANYRSDSSGTRALYDTITDTVSSFRTKNTVPQYWKHGLKDESAGENGAAPG